MLVHKTGYAVLLLILMLFPFSQKASAETVIDEEVFLKILHEAYQASCGDVDSLKNYYFPDAEIIHDGRQRTLEETMKELKQSLASLRDLNCAYHPRVRSFRANGPLAYVVVRESLTLEAREMGKRMIQQVCTYVFMKHSNIWMIAHDHCSSIPGIET